MSLPERIRVRITSEGAESIGLSPVVVQEMTPDELVQEIIGLTAKDAQRVGEILARGSLVSGASRFRWEGVAAPEADLLALLARFPDANPALPFEPARCFLAVFQSRGRQVSLERSAGEKRRMFRRRSFWDALLALVDVPEYVAYSYRERADLYRSGLDAGMLGRLRSEAKLLAYSSVEAQIRSLPITSVDLYVRRDLR